ncbi:hypothetical protein C8J56DRAFT_1125779 [Mycena floridula]|nr:hypothetical protein C8J56DRAFT_1125779 [Mycena floridula]
MSNAHCKLTYVLAGRKNQTWGIESPRGTGVYNEMPWIPGGAGRLPFPLAIECPTSTDAEYLHHALQPIANKWDIRQSMHDLLEKLDSCPAVKEVTASIDSKIRFFLVVLVGKKPGIYLSRSLAQASLTRPDKERKYRDLIIYTSFNDALKSLITGGRHQEGKCFRGYEVPATWPAAGRDQTAVKGYNEEEEFAVLDDIIRSLDWEERFGLEKSQVLSSFFHLFIPMPSKLEIELEKEKKQVSIRCEIKRLVQLWAPPRPRIWRIPLEQRNSELSEQHWYTPVLCMGKGTNFEHIGRWIPVCIHDSKDGHHCSGWGPWLTQPLSEIRRTQLRELKRKYEETGKEWRDDESTSEKKPKEQKRNASLSTSSTAVAAPNPKASHPVSPMTVSISLPMSNARNKDVVALKSNSVSLATSLSAPVAKGGHIGRPHVRWNSVNAPGQKASSAVEKKVSKSLGVIELEGDVIPASNSVNASVQKASSAVKVSKSLGIIVLEDDLTSAPKKSSKGKKGRKSSEIIELDEDSASRKKVKWSYEAIEFDSAGEEVIEIDSDDE